MAGYTKNIAVVKGLKEGFSSDGNSLTGVIKVERYGSVLQVGVTKVNFAPLTAGKYVTGVTDGKSVLVLDGDGYEGESELDTSDGFGALITFVNAGKVAPVASAVSGNFFGELLLVKEAIEKFELSGDKTVYEDEAIAEENYYEYAETDGGDSPLREDTPQEKTQTQACQNAVDFSPVKETDGVKYGRQYAEDNGVKAEKFARAAAAFLSGDESVVNEPVADILKGKYGGGLAGGDFYKTVENEVENVLSSYPRAEDLCAAIEGSKWVKISYGGKKYYVFGVIFSNGKPAYLCYGVPSESKTPPKSMRKTAARLTCPERSYWIMYQDANTGASIHIEEE